MVPELRETPEQATTYKASELQAKLQKAFTPHAPISLPDFLAGRKVLIYRVMDAINTEGLHVVIYGDRGTGKTSIARVVAYMAQESEKPAGRRCILIQCAADDTFSSIWRKVGQEILLSQRQLGFRFQETREIIGRLELDHTILTPSDARIFLESVESPLVIIFDEFDRIRDMQTRVAMADNIKFFSDCGVKATLALVGVGKVLSDLLQEHLSIGRNVAQVKVEPMELNELVQVVQNGCKYCGLTVESEVDSEIARLSQGYPHYTHLLGLWAGRKTVEAKRMMLTHGDLHAAIPDALRNAVGGLQDQYERAIYSPQKANLFREVLLACALAPKDSLGRFAVGALQEPLRLITGRDYLTGAYQAHLGKFCDDAHGKILEREGQPKLYRWRFLNPQLIPYIVLQGVSQGLIQPGKIPRHRV